MLNPRRTGQEGQTLVLVAVCLFVLIAMAALAIDLTTLYVARGEMQRAADAAALAGAKAFVDSGTTTATTTEPALQTLAQTMGTQIINSLLTQNTVGGATPALVGAPVYDFSNPGNPKITVTLQRTDVPTFFAKIFGQRLVKVTATATAEAYNSSNPPGGAGANMPPVAPSCVKPWLIPNYDPQHSPDPFVIPATGALAHPGIYPAGIIGEEITLLNDCNPGGPVCTPVDPLPIAHPPGGLDFLAAQLAAASGTCPSCAGGTDYEQSTACCDTGNSAQYACGASAPGVLIDLTTNIITNTITSVECLIGASSAGYGAGQDEIGLGTGAQPPADSFGNFLASNGNDPIEILSGSGSHAGQMVTTSPSIVTIPIYDTTGVINLVAPVKIIGFMQAFVEQAMPAPGNGNVQIYVLNISGCGPNVNTALTPVTGGGVSPVPVRLIHN
jgi:Flp pilus assembly protein TadG